MGPCQKTAPPELQKAIEEFNSGEWFECHETLEELWVGEKGELRDLYQGLLQIAVALYHWRNGNFKGAVGLLQRGSDFLRRVSPRCLEVDVARVIADAAAMHEALEGLGEERMAEVGKQLVPRLHRVQRP
jgi:predicted metal-dependent hydrolase